jgi:DNA polymerase I-like protein with 3'-5' exonuclease and polymerase domains
MTRLCVVDAETFYSREFSLTKLTTEAYVRDKQFETIGLSAKFDDDKTIWLPKPHVEEFLRDTDWSDVAIIGQNTAFDGAILHWRYGVRPEAWLDIMGMSRALFPHEKSHSLKSQAERMGVGVKGDEVLNALGKRYGHFSAEELARYGEYCKNDVDLTHKLFHMYMEMGFPLKELKLIDMTLRMFIEPRLILDADRLRDHLTDVKKRKVDLLEQIWDTFLNAEADLDARAELASQGLDGVKKMLMSNDKFAKALQDLGVEPPTKISPTTGKTAWAFAKTDEEFKALEEHPDEAVQALVAARLGNKTTLEETRTERFIDMATRGAFPVPLRYYGAHSGRWSGQDSVNMQNLPSRGANAGKIKKAIKAPPGHVVIDCDSAQIEARVLAWLAGQEDLVEAFERKEDVYKLMASKIYGVPVADIDKQQRQVGKTVVLGCFGPDTLVLTTRGWIPIIHVQVTDMVWDGLRWVSHAGVVPQGEKDVWTAHGISATSDHEILTEHGWAPWSEVIENPSLWQSAKAVASSLSLSGSHIQRRGEEQLGGTLFVDAPADGRALSFVRIYSRGVALGATIAPKLRHMLNAIGSMKAFAQMKLHGRGSLTESPLVCPGATTPTTEPTETTDSEVSKCTRRGGRTASRSSPTSWGSPGTSSRIWSWIESTWIGATSRAIFASWGVQPTWQIGAAFDRYKHGSAPLKQRTQTYDIAYAGPRNRYTILTDEGPIVVHNCGYGVGHIKLQGFLKTQAGVEVSLGEAKRIIDTYRSASYKIADFWKKAGSALQYLISGQAYTVDAPGLIRVVPGKGLTLPSGLYIQYPNLRSVVNAEGKQEYVYTSKGLPVRIYGGKVVENICQAVARQVVAEQMLRIQKRYPVVLTVHDAAAIIAPVAEAKEAQAYVEECMSWNPKWATGLPLACEAGMGESYGDC